MALKKIQYQGFRNLIDNELQFSQDFNFIIGENGAGKTNLLEAIFFVGLASSFRVRDEKKIIRDNDEFLRVDAEANNKNAIIYLDSSKKKLILQGNEIRRISRFIGWLNITIISLEDIWIVRGAPSERRAFLDWTIAKISPAYLDSLIEYRKVLRQRNKTLQSYHENGKQVVLDLFDEQLINTGNALYELRKMYIPELKEKAAAISNDLGLADLSFHYHCTCPDMKLDHEILQQVREKEINFGHTVVGPHRDDLIFSCNDRVLKNYASEGEERTVSIALKLAEAEMLCKKNGQYPIILLDEVSAELDSKRKQKLLQLLKGQVFYASTQMPNLDLLGNKDIRLFSARQGTIEIS